MKTEYDESQGIALAESHEEAVDASLRHFSVMAAKRSAAIFVGTSGERFRKIRRRRNELSGKQRASDPMGHRVKGNAVPFGGVKRRQSLIWVLGRSVWRGSRASPRPVKCWEPTLSTGYYLPT